jgi:hypothetical protein
MKLLMWFNVKSYLAKFISYGNSWTTTFKSIVLFEVFIIKLLFEVRSCTDGSSPKYYKLLFILFRINFLPPNNKITFLIIALEQLLKILKGIL